MQHLLDKTLSQIVTETYQAARIFEKYGLDFCCKGKRPLREACQEKQISIEPLLNELKETMAKPAGNHHFNEMSLTELAEYIVRIHHGYVKTHAPQILDYIWRVASKHGDRFPFMHQVYTLFDELKTELDQHMLKEEIVLFPRIKQLEMGMAQGAGEFLQSPIDVMEMEHAKAGALMQSIRELTNNYEAPAQACTTFRLALDSLKAFEEDLHHHVHLENNILFSKALTIFEAPACAIRR